MVSTLAIASILFAVPGKFSSETVVMSILLKISVAFSAPLEVEKRATSGPLYYSTTGHPACGDIKDKDCKSLIIPACYPSLRLVANDELRVWCVPFSSDPDARLLMPCYRFDAALCALAKSNPDWGSRRSPFLAVEISLISIARLLPSLTKISILILR
jgi:hypothetical protein